MPLIECGLLLLLAMPAPPQPDPSPSPSPSPTAPPSRAEYVEVTAKGLHEEADTVPAMVTVMSGDELRARGATDLRAALCSVAGVDVDCEAIGHRVELLGVKCSDGVLRTNMLQVLTEEAYLGRAYGGGGSTPFGGGLGPLREGLACP